MSEEDGISPRGRRVVLRRSRGGARFSSGGSSRVDGAPRDLHDFDGDEVEQAIDPEAVASRVRERANTNFPAPADDGGAPNPRTRLFEVEQAGSANYSQEFRLNLLHRLLIRKLPLDQIARQLGVSISTVEKDRAKLRRMLRERARELDIEELVGNQTGFYDEVAAMALRIADGGGDNPPPTAMRLAAMRTALASNADKTRFYQSAGVFDVLRFRRAEGGDAVSDVQLLMQRTGEMIAQLVESERGERSRPRPGFKDFSIQDEDPEIMDI